MNAVKVERAVAKRRRERVSEQRRQTKIAPGTDTAVSGTRSYKTRLIRTRRRRRPRAFVSRSGSTNSTSQTGCFIFPFQFLVFPVFF